MPQMFYYSSLTVAILDCKLLIIKFIEMLSLDDIERKPNIGQNILSLVCLNDHQLRSVILILHNYTF